VARRAIVDATIYPVVEEPIADGAIVFDGSRIVAIGQRHIVTADTDVVSAAGGAVIPGLIEPHCHLGLFETHLGWEGSDGDEATETGAGPHLRALDAVNPDDDAFAQARSTGVTAVHILPSSLTVIGGQTVVLKNIPNATVDQMQMRAPAGIKMALGENPKRENAIRRFRYPSTRMGLAATIRRQLVEARTYLDTGQRPRNLDHEAIAGLLERRYPIHMHCHRADDIATALRLAEEFGLDLVVHHGTEAFLLAELLASRRVPLVWGPLAMWSYKSETRLLGPSGARQLLDAGVAVALTTDAPVVPIQYLDLNVREILSAGGTADEALGMLTYNPARILGVDDRIGSLEAGKDADIVVLSGQPFAGGTGVTHVFVNGIPAWTADGQPQLSGG